MQRSGVLEAETRDALAVQGAEPLSCADAGEPQTFPQDAIWGPWGHSPHWHPRHQFLSAAAGTCRMTVGERQFEVSRERGVWIPRGMVHSARYCEDFVALPFLLDAQGPSEPTALEIAPALRRTLVAWQWAEASDERAGYEQDLLTALGQPGTPARLSVTEPRGPLTAPVAAYLRRDPASDRTLDQWALILHTSVASIRRAFLAETGISYSRWRTRYRLNLSLPGLLAGRPVAVVAREVGFTNNGYTQAFRRHLGCAPSSFGTPRQR